MQGSWNRIFLFIPQIHLVLNMSGIIIMATIKWSIVLTGSKILYETGIEQSS